MSLKLSGNGGAKQLPPEGKHVARCIWIADLGTQHVVYEAENKKLRRIWIEFELSDAKTVFSPADGEVPFTIGAEYTFYLGKRTNLRRDLEAWRGKAFTAAELREFEFSKLLGVPCMLRVIHRVNKAGRKYATIDGVSPVPKGTTVPEQTRPSLKYEIESGADDAFKKFPEFLQAKIAGSDEWKARDENNGREAAARQPAVPDRSVKISEATSDDYPY